MDDNDPSCYDCGISGLCGSDCPIYGSEPECPEEEEPEGILCIIGKCSACGTSLLYKIETENPLCQDCERKKKTEQIDIEQKADVKGDER